ncbi:MAG: endonuclease III domain-containing protein [Candidatus Cloacimonadota bacterium]|nr:endonuclease III domain-containing protein [Candidatus Cloacimonadota bacterium]
MQVEDLFDLLLIKFGHQNWWPGETLPEIIVGAILTQNTNWKNVEKSIDNLRKHDLIDFSAILKTGTDELAQLIYSSGYYNQKAERLKKVAEYFVNSNDLGNLETTKFREQLLSINGIGPETADSILLYAFERPVFVIDAYTKRIGQRLGFWNEKISYEEAQKYFQDRLISDEKIFNEFHALLVKLGKDFCRKKPLCSKCYIKNECNKL